MENSSSHVVVDCWEFPHLEFKRKVVVQNKKYCWLYSQQEAKEIKKIIPNFDHCQTLYTRCDYILEKKTQQQILKLEIEFRVHNEVMKQQLVIQKELLECMWKLSQRYMLLTNSALCIKPYPEIVSAPAEQHALCGYQKRLTKINLSNCTISESLKNIRNSIEELNHRCKQLDFTVESPFLLGTWFQGSLADIRKMISHLFQFYYDDICVLKRWAELLTPGDPAATEDYQELLESLLSDRKRLYHLNQMCQCRKIRNLECITVHRPCTSHNSKGSFETEASKTCYFSKTDNISYIEVV